MHPKLLRLSKRLLYVVGLVLLAECIRMILHDLSESDFNDEYDSQDTAMGSWSLVNQGKSKERKAGEPCDSITDGYQCQPAISHYWGQYSPYYSVPSTFSDDVPKHCQVTFSQVLARHAARDPTLYRTLLYNATLTRLKSGAKEFKGVYAFLSDYEYNLGADQLTPFGEQQMINAGKKFYKRYAALSRTQTPFIRAAGQKRVVDSAVLFAKGFHMSKAADKRASGETNYPYDILVIPESRSENNTLSNELCPAFRHGTYAHYGSQHQLIFAKTFVPTITSRLNADLGVLLTDVDTIALMDLCPFDTVAQPHGTPLSPFCNLFSIDEWKQYDYYQSVGKYYGYGPGNPLAPTQGVGFANELIARLTRTPVQDHTSVNHTLDNSPTTFPYNNETISLFADFSHDNDMTSIYAALGLYNNTTPLSTEHISTPEETDGYSASWTVPFGGRIYVEKLSCVGGAEEAGEKVRLLVNDRVVPPRNCNVDRWGMCTVEKFVESLSFARQGDLWDQCFVQTSFSAVDITTGYKTCNYVFHT